jgi:hypothetical protein
VTRSGAFVELLGVQGRVDGMVHISNMSPRRITDVAEVCQRGQEVWVKVLGIQEPKPGQTRPRIELSMRDVDQSTGVDLLPLHDTEHTGGLGVISPWFLLSTGLSATGPLHVVHMTRCDVRPFPLSWSPCRRVCYSIFCRMVTVPACCWLLKCRCKAVLKLLLYSPSTCCTRKQRLKEHACAGMGLKGLSGIKNVNPSGRPKRRRQHLSEAEIFELRQLVASGVKNIKDCPELLADDESDEDAGAMMRAQAAIEEDFEVSLSRLLLHTSATTAMDVQYHACQVFCFAIPLLHACPQL